MRKFRKVLDGLTTSSPGATLGSPSCGSGAGTPTAAPTPKEIDVQETLLSENFQLCKTVRHGFPYQPTALAFDPVQKILAVGSRSGGVRILGRPGVDCYCQHESGAAVLQLQFLINEGALVTACADDTLHLWNLRQRRPAVLHSLKFNRERTQRYQTFRHPTNLLQTTTALRVCGDIFSGAHRTRGDWSPAETFMYTGDPATLEGGRCSRPYSTPPQTGSLPGSFSAPLRPALNALANTANFLNMIFQASDLRESTVQEDMEWYHALVRALLEADLLIQRALLTFDADPLAAVPQLVLRASRNPTAKIQTIILQDLSKAWESLHPPAPAPSDSWFRSFKFPESKQPTAALSKRLLLNDLSTLDTPKWRQGDSYVTNRSGVRWASAPFLDCKEGRFVPRWLLTLSAPFYGLKPDLTPEFRGVIRVDVDIQDIDLDQCTTGDSWFADTHQCNRTTMECVPVPGRGFRLGQYCCRCKEGYFNPDIVPPDRDGGPVNTSEDGRVCYPNLPICLPCWPGCRSCQDGAPCWVQEAWLLRAAVLAVQGVFMLLIFVSMLVAYRHRRNRAIHSVSWHHEGKQFMCSHSDGSLTLWNLRNTTKPFQVTFPHGKIQKDGRKESCKPILKVEYKTSRSSEPFVIFSGGLSYDKAGRRPTLTIMHGKAITALEMDYPIVEFMVLCETPYNNEVQEPYAVVVLLEKDLIVVDLTQSSFPVFENPYPMDVHESPVTSTAYFADCPPDIIPILYSIGAKHKKTGYSQKEWPISGGTWTLGSHTYPEIIITGHADGTIKFWDASAITLQMLYKLKTSKVFEKPKPGEGRAAELVEEDPFAVQMVSWCPQSRMFCVVGISAHIILYHFSKHEANTQIEALEVRLQCESEDVISPSENENDPCFSESGSHSPQPHHRQPASPSSGTPEGIKHSVPCLKVKDRMVRVPPGYQAELVIQLQWIDGEPPQQITSLDINSAYGLLAFGNCNGLAVVDYLQKTVLLCMSTLDLYGAADPYQRLTRSPRRHRQSTSEFCMRGLSNFYSDSKKRIRTSYQSLTELSDNQQSIDMERSKSPTSVHYPTSLHNDPRILPEPVASLRASHCSPVFYLLDNVKGPGRKLSLPTDLKTDLDHVNGHCTSPTSQPCSAGKPRVPMGPEGPRLTRRGPGRPPFRKAQSAACMEISLPVSHTEGYASRRAMLQQLHGVTMYSHDEHHTSAPYCWSDRATESRENSFSRSRSSSVSSIDRDTKEAITTLQFGESYGRKSDALTTPCLWVGTSLGVVLLIPMSIPTDQEERMEESVTFGPSGAVLMLKGSVLNFGFLDCTGALIQRPYEVWRDINAAEDPDRPRKRKLVHFSPSSSQETYADGHLAVVCSERQAKVFLMPSQSCLFVHNITESSFVLRADVVSVCNSVCLACFCANGHVMILSLPSLRPLMDVNYLPLTDMRIARTFCFTNGGQALYLSSPTEIQRITYSQEMCDNLQEMLGELFTPIETPEVQNRGFLKGFFGGNAHTFDREELFGEAAAGKASRSLAQHIPGQAGMEGMKVAAGGAVGELARARIALDERGQRLGELEERTALMMTSAEAFSKHAHELMLKCKDKKWYQF
ncbi:syntaxin-binding protein 5-like [Cheilinus undulatus]|uniref:syntaxin-binding protein 5-like n=1 Tax=Cheilinus undulatus TaxID=241271 RepID=UPI001BD48D12|nr:syntaxin-binding protein 5-like [Cheilinus undulatus]